MQCPETPSPTRDTLQAGPKLLSVLVSSLTFHKASSASQADIYALLAWEPLPGLVSLPDWFLLVSIIAWLFLLSLQHSVWIQLILQSHSQLLQAKLIPPHFSFMELCTALVCVCHEVILGTGLSLIYVFPILTWHLA